MNDTAHVYCHLKANYLLLASFLNVFRITDLLRSVIATDSLTTMMLAVTIPYLGM